MPWELIPITDTKGIAGYALVDAADAGKVQSHSWNLSGAGYAISKVKRNGRWTSESMHRLITGAQPGQDVDHANHEPLDNRRCNLRVCSRSQNNQNMQPRSDKRHSRYKGVTWSQGKYQARICINKGRKCLGHFDDETEAARAYDTAARSYFGNFAYVNFTGGE